MKRPCFALTLLLTSLAGSLLATGSAKCQSGPDPAPAATWHGESCPYAPSYSHSSGSVGNGYDGYQGYSHDEDARWQAHQAQEQELQRSYEQPSEAIPATPEPVVNSAPAYEAEVPATVESAPAIESEIPAVVETTPVVESVPAIESTVPAAVEPAVVETAPAIEADYNYRSDYDNSYDYEVYRPEQYPAPVETPAIPATEELDPYWIDGTIPSDVIESLDPYWTEGKMPADVAVELDPYWTEGTLPADVVNNDQIDNQVEGNIDNTVVESAPETVVDPQWAKDSEEAVETWIEKLNSTEQANQPVDQGGESGLEPQTDANIEQPAQSSDSTYGAHLWDNCELEGQPRNCDKEIPSVINYGADQVETQPSLSPAEQRALLLIVARSLNEAGVILQNASEGIERIVGETTEAAPVTEDAPATEGVAPTTQGYEGYEGYEAYRD